MQLTHGKQQRKLEFKDAAEGVLKKPNKQASWQLARHL